MNTVIAGYYDYAVITILILLNLIFWKKRKKINAGCIIATILFGFILPLISQWVEIQRVKNSIGIMDNFEVLYTFFRFPLYWGIGIVQSIILNIKN